MTVLASIARLRENAHALPRRIRRGAESISASPHPRPVFILGHQKSGTSAVAALLAEMTLSSVAVDLVNEDRRPSYQRVVSGEMSFERFVRRNRLDFSCDIVKEPNLTLLYPELCTRFPRAPKIMVVRDPRTTIKSVLNRLGFPGDRADLTTREKRLVRRGWDLALDPTWLGLHGTTYIEVLAARWVYYADVYLNHRDDMELVRYEDFRSDKIAELKRLAHAVGLVPRASISHLLEVQFQPRGDEATPIHEFFSAENLAIIEKVCGASMADLGYSVGVGGRSQEQRAT